MTDTSRPGNQNPKPDPDQQHEKRPQDPDQEGDHPAEDEPAVERGERLDTGKAIARGGKEGGKVRGATDEAEEEGD